MEINLYDYITEGSVVTYQDVLFIAISTLVLSLIVALIRKKKGQD